MHPYIDFFLYMDVKVLILPDVCRCDVALMSLVLIDLANAAVLLRPGFPRLFALTSEYSHAIDQ